ncbi:glycosyltransferase family 2 protein [Rhodococcus ruber]|uniref:glycosyltransferase family 2 protein n=1 Tax=Rhodococcus ruber TaxID=1830 RepID=UPI0009E1F969|nr:glycosyltransferase family 2 protein [Rhodococcus ruber]MDO1480748.1 glycosyltransferase family 2 protein [Rhodococcus ruber]
MANMSGEIYVVIVNYYSSGLVAQLLESLDLAPLAAVMIVDNSDNAGEWGQVEATSSRFGVNCIQMPSNLGFGAGVNRGVEALNPRKGGFVWVLNPDTRVGPNSAVSLVAALTENGADVASPVIITDPDERVWYGGGFLDARRGRTTHWEIAPEDVTECTFVTGAAMMVRESAWRRLGGFREDLFMYWEDADLCIRANRLGMTMVVVPSVRIWHAVGATTSDSGKSALYYFYMQRNRIVVLGEHFGLRGLASRDALLEALRISVRTFREESRRSLKFAASARGVVKGLRLLQTKDIG